MKPKGQSVGLSRKGELLTHFFKAEQQRSGHTLSISWREWEEGDRCFPVLKSVLVHTVSYSFP